MSNKLDLRGQVFGKLVAIEEAGKSADGEVLWRCRCECGGECVVRLSSLRSTRTRSCGCLKRAKCIERNIKHGLRKSNPRLYGSVHNHFRFIRKGLRGYQNWSLDTRYSNDVDGVVKFCHDLLALQPDACARYEVDKTLDLDKDNNAENIFRPESIVFRPSLENRGKQYNNLRLDDGCSLSTFCRRVGVPTRENGRESRVYARIREMYRIYHKSHPELVQKANELICLYTRTLKMVKLLEDAKRLVASCGIQS